MRLSRLFDRRLEVKEVFPGLQADSLNGPAGDFETALEGLRCVAGSVG